MIVFPLFLALAACATSATGANVSVVWQHAKASRQTALSVFDGVKLVAQTCSSLLAGTPQSSSIDFSDVDVNGLGLFRVGAITYQTHSDPAFSGGPICTKKYNDAVAVVQCAGVDWTPAVPGDAPLAASCYEDVAVQDTIRFFMSSQRVRAADIESGGAILTERNITTADCNIITTTNMVGDGNPHQNFFDKQISENIFCGAAPSCSVGRSVIRSFSIGWSASATAYAWITGGFAVQQSWSTGNDYHCSGSTGETVCVWYNTAHTAYTVQNAELNTCENEHRWSPDGNPFVMFSPNVANRNGGYYCVVGTCRALGDAYWDYSGRAGGP